MSHSKEGVACVFSKEEIGIDIQGQIAYSENLARKICSEEEYLELCRSESKDILLTRYWTLKESYLKCKGIGITEDLRNLNFSKYENNTFDLYNYCFFIDNLNKYSIAVCAKYYSISICRISMRELLDHFMDKSELHRF